MRISINPQRVYASILAYMISFLSLMTLVNAITNELGFVTSLDSYMFVATLLGMLAIGFYSLLFEKSKSRGDCFILLASFGCAYLFSIVLFPQNSKYIFTNLSDLFGNPLYSIFVFSLPAYLFARHLKEYNLFCGILRSYAYAVVGLSVITFLFAQNSFATQYLSFSYNMLLHLLFLFFYRPKKGRVLHNILVAFGVFVFIVGGARGALLSFVICSVAYFLFERKQTLRKTTIIILGAVAVCIFLSYKNEILLRFAEVLSRMNISSRTINKIIIGEALNSSGRDEIANQLINKLNAFGYGMMGDRVICSGIYAHNLFLELLIDFGIVLGAILSVVIITIIAFGVIRKIEKNHVWVILLLSTGFLKLMLSGSYLDFEPVFYVLMGFCVNSLMENKEYVKIAQKDLCADKI